MNEDQNRETIEWRFYHGPEKENIDPNAWGGIDTLKRPPNDQTKHRGAENEEIVQARKWNTLEQKKYQLIQSKMPRALQNSNDTDESFLALKKDINDNVDELPMLEEEIPKPKKTNFRITQKVEKRKMKGETNTKKRPAPSLFNDYPEGVKPVQDVLPSPKEWSIKQVGQMDSSERHG